MTLRDRVKFWTRLIGALGIDAISLSSISWVVRELHVDIMPFVKPPGISGEVVYYFFIAFDGIVFLPVLFFVIIDAAKSVKKFIADMREL